MSAPGQAGRSFLDAALLAALAALPVLGPVLGLGATLARPAGLALYGLAVPLVVLHVLKPRRVRRTVGSVLLWREVERTLEERHPFQRLRRNLPLFLELLALAALAMALAGPRFRGGAGGGHDVVLVLDASASMKTRDGPGGLTRFDAAVAEARGLVQGLRGGERGLVLVATPRGARTAQGWTDDPAALEDALRALRCTDGPADLGEALVLAAAAARPLGEKGEVVVLSDGGGPPVPALELKARLVYRALGSTDENVGLVAAQVRAGEDAADAAERSVSVLVSVLNAGPSARHVFLELLDAGGASRAARRLDLAPRARAAIVLEARLVPGLVRARVVAAPGDLAGEGPLDRLPEDDEVALVVPPADALVALVTSRRERGPLERALVAAAGRVERRGPEGPFDPALRLVVFEGVVPAALPRTRCLLVGPPEGQVGPVAVGAPVEAPELRGFEREDRLFRFVTLDDVRVERARHLRLPAGARTLVASDRTPLVVGWADGDASRTLVGFDLADSSWPLRLSFPVFVRNCVLAALEDDALGPRGTVRAGTTVSLRAAPGTASLSVATPRGRSLAAPVEDERALFSDTDEAGVYRVREPSGRETLFAVGTLEEGETRVGPRTELAFGDEVIPAVPEGPGEREVLLPFLLLALGAVVLEGFAFHRRW